MPASIDIIDILLDAVQGERDDLHTAMPGQVVAYYPDRQTADIQPMLKRPVFDEDGNRLDGASLPVLPDVPVNWPRAGGYMFTMPLSKGDFVWIMFSEGGHGEFRQTGQESEPFDVSRHQITYPTCMPGCFPDSAKITDADVTANDRVVIGKGTTKIEIHEVDPLVPGDTAYVKLGSDATDYAALASKVDDAISKLQTAFDNHTHATAGTGTPSAPMPMPPSTVTIPVGTLSSSASPFVKIK